MMPIEETILRLAVALALGAIFGVEREWRQRMAGLRTNVLVTLGAASFTVFSLMYPEETSPTRVGAQVVSGIGFLGGGVILRTGVNVRGLTTAATLWCAAAVGVLAGAGFLLEAAAATGFVLVTNVLLRPLDRLINRGSRRRIEGDHHYTIRLTVLTGEEGAIRSRLLSEARHAGLQLHGVEGRTLADAGRTDLEAQFTAESRNDGLVKDLAERLATAQSVTGASWHYSDDRQERDHGPPRFFRAD